MTSCKYIHIVCNKLIIRMIINYFQYTLHTNREMILLNEKWYFYFNQPFVFPFFAELILFSKPTSYRKLFHFWGGFPFFFFIWKWLITSIENKLITHTHTQENQIKRFPFNRISSHSIEYTTIFTIFDLFHSYMYNFIFNNIHHFIFLI